MKLTSQNLNTLAARKTKKGFTLMEVIVVMAIIFGLAGIGFGDFFQMNNTAKEGETRAILNAVSEAMVARSADISSDQRGDVGVQTGFIYPTGDGGDKSTEALVSYISGDFDGNGYIDDNARTKSSAIVPGQTGSSSYLNDDDVIVDSWGTPIRYTFPGDYHNEDNGFDLESAGPDREFDTDDDIILK